MVPSRMSPIPEDYPPARDLEDLQAMNAFLSERVANLASEIDGLKTLKAELDDYRSGLKNRVDPASKPSPLKSKFPLRREEYEDWTEELVRTISQHDAWFKDEERKLDYLIESASGFMRLFLRDRYGYRARDRACKSRPLKLKDALADLDVIFLPPDGDVVQRARRQWLRLELDPQFHFSAFLPKFLFYSHRAGFLDQAYRTTSLFRCLPRSARQRPDIKPFGSDKKNPPGSFRDLVDRLFAIEAEKKVDDGLVRSYTTGEPDSGEGPEIYRPELCEGAKRYPADLPGPERGDVD
ncbi:hypothetical protein IWZ00DRAFT_339113 [Phyllosticta capitalensis]